MTDRIALYGGSFDPIHNGHLIVARAVAERLDIGRVLFLPAAAPPHKGAEALSDPLHRGEMVRQAIREDALFSFSEYDLQRAGPHYTIDAVTHFRGAFGPDIELCWIIGADSLAELATWRRIADLVETCRLVTAGRPGWSQSPWDALRPALGQQAIAKLKDGILATPLIDISSTDIRRRVRAGQSIAHLVPECVRTYIDAHGLYR